MEEKSFLAALQLADSFFPSGTVTLSHGLEAYLANEELSVSDISDILKTHLEVKVGPLDLVAYSHAYDAVEHGDIPKVHEIDRFFHVSLVSEEIRRGSIRSGRATLETLSQVTAAPHLRRFLRGVRSGLSNGHAPVCSALAHVNWDVPKRTGGLLMLHTFAVGYLGAAIRLGSIGHTDAQRMLWRARQRFVPIVDLALETPLADMGSFAPVADIRTMQHAHLEVRLFST